MAHPQTECQQQRYSFDEAVFFFWEWHQRDPYVALAACARESRAGTYRGQPLAERVMEAIVAESMRAIGVASVEFVVPQRPPRFDRRSRVGYPTPGKSVVTQVDYSTAGKPEVKRVDYRAPEVMPPPPRARAAVPAPRGR